MIMSDIPIHSRMLRMSIPNAESSTRFHSMPYQDRHPPMPAVAAAAPPPPSKPRGGARLLSFFLQALIMAVALSLFFLFAGVAALVLLHLCVAGRSLTRRRRHVHAFNSRQSDAYPSRLALSPGDLQTLPSFAYSDCGKGAVCAVCLEAFRDGDRCRRLPGCGHEFHMACVDRWLVRSAACPICRGGVAVDVMDPGDGW